MKTPPVIEFKRGKLWVLDQTLLPEKAVAVELENLAAVENAIRTLKVRGAPLIGVSAAYGMCVALRDARTAGEAREMGREAARRLSKTRPTAVNLFWALERMSTVLAELTGTNWRERLEAEARAIHDETRAQDAAMAKHGRSLLQEGEDSTEVVNVVTHCNTGPLATGGLGTALGVLIQGHRALGNLHVYVDETRPRWQGAHLTTWELGASGVPHTLICDNAAGALMRTETIHSVWVGADRIAANGDTANKIGTYSLAVNARHHGVPFYVVAPSSTVDLSLDGGGGIPIEQRDPAEVSAPGGRRITAQGSGAWNPAFDVTPAALVTAIVTERGIHRGHPEYDLRKELG